MQEIPPPQHVGQVSLRYLLPSSLILHVLPMLAPVLHHFEKTVERGGSRHRIVGGQRAQHVIKSFQ